MIKLTVETDNGGATDKRTVIKEINEKWANWVMRYDDLDHLMKFLVDMSEAHLKSYIYSQDIDEYKHYSTNVFICPELVEQLDRIYETPKYYPYPLSLKQKKITKAYASSMKKMGDHLKRELASEITELKSIEDKLIQRGALLRCQGMPLEEIEKDSLFQCHHFIFTALLYSFIGKIELYITEPLSNPSLNKLILQHIEARLITLRKHEITMDEFIEKLDKNLINAYVIYQCQCSVENIKHKKRANHE